MWVLILPYAALVVQATIILVWLWQHVEMNRIRAEGLWVANRPPNRELPPVTVLIPARNEAGRIGECVRSVLFQNYPGLQAIVVDDRSDDGTAACAEKAAPHDARLQVHRIDSLPHGWGGKSHALWRGAQVADTPWILFLDADCRVERDGIASAMAYAIDSRADLLSLWPKDGSQGFWERLLVPLCGAMIVIWYGRAARNDPASPAAFANGQFMLFRRAAYFKTGGHAAVRNAIVEDIPLARLAKSKGMSVQSAIGTEIYTVRMYASLREVVSGWVRIYLGVLTPVQIALSAISILFGSLPPYFMLPILVIARRPMSGYWVACFVVLNLLHLAALMATSIRFFGLARCRLRYLWLYPVSCVGVLCILGSALVRRIGRSEVRWRGTTYKTKGASIRN